MRNSRTNKKLRVAMKRLRLFGVMLMAMCAMAFMTTSAFALPDISITLGGVYPLHLNYESTTVRGGIQNVSGGILQSEGLHELYLIGESTVLGTFRAIFL